MTDSSTPEQSAARTDPADAPTGAAPAAGGSRASEWLAALVAGLVVGVITVSAEISLALLIFSGELSDFVSNGVGLLLAGSLVATLITGLASSYPGTVSPNQDVPAAVLAVLAAGIAAGLAASTPPGEIYATVLAAIVVTSLLTGLIFLLQGYFRLGALFRFLPYPVVGGFLAGTGWLLASGGLFTMAGSVPGLAEVPVLFQGDVWPRWLPGAAFAVTMLLVLNRFSHYLIMPGMILAAAGLFYAVVLLLDVPMEQVSDRGWLLGPFPEGGLWRPVSAEMLSGVHWYAVYGQAGNIAAVVIVSALALLLSAGGLELTVERDIELDRELRAAGLGSVGSGLAGGIVSYPALGLSVLGYRIGGSSRLIALMVAVVIGLVLYFGPNALSWTPKMIFGGLLMFLGLSLLEEWVYKAWYRFPRIDFLIIASILLVIAAVGFLQGVILGVALALILFVVSYSRVDVVRHAFPGSSYRSRVIRRDAHRRLLEQESDSIHVFQLQGFIFFGTANKLLNHVRQRMEADTSPPLRFVVLDFRHVTGLDSTALLSFTKMKQLAQNRGIVLAFCNTTGPDKDKQGAMSKLLARLDDGEQRETAGILRVFQDLDRTLEWCENRLLTTTGADPDEGRENLLDYLQSLLPGDDTVDALLQYFERLDVDAGYHLMRQGDPPDALYFIESGQVTVQLEPPDRDPIRLEAMRGGRVVGEIGFFVDRPRTAAVVTDEPSTIYRLSRQTLNRMEQSDPQSAYAFHQSIIRLLADRVIQLNDTLQALRI